MKKLVTNFAFLVCLALLFQSCNDPVKDWNNAKQVNSIIGYKKFIKDHSSDGNTDKAKIAIDSLELIDCLKGHNPDSLIKYFKDHGSSNFLKNSLSAMDSLEWNIAFFSKDTAKLRTYSEKYPNSLNSAKAKELVWEIQWPPIKLEKVNSLRIWHNGFKSCHGQWKQAMVVREGHMDFFGPGSVLIDIFRDFVGYEKEAKKSGLIIGVAYTTINGKYRFVKKVDLSKSDAQICKEFNVSELVFSGQN